MTELNEQQLTQKLEWLNETMERVALERAGLDLFAELLQGEADRVVAEGASRGLVKVSKEDAP